MSVSVQTACAATSCKCPGLCGGCCCLDDLCPPPSSEVTEEVMTAEEVTRPLRLSSKERRRLGAQTMACW